jgi:KDO2-lipid IV(A) lauroyltransferase
MRLADIADARTWARRMYASLGTALLEFLWMAGRGGEPLAGKVELTERARAALALRRHTGLIVATAHTGNWDLVGCAAAGELLPRLGIATQRLHIGWLDRLWQGARSRRGAILLHGEGLFTHLMEHVLAGYAVALLIDQAPERASAVVELPFLGRPARCDLTPALLAARTGAPIALALGYRRTDGTHLVDIPCVLEPPPEPSRAWMTGAMARLTSELGEFVQAHPDQWLWLHRRWKAFVPREERAARRVAASSRGRRSAPPSLVSQPAER